MKLRILIGALVASALAIAVLAPHLGCALQEEQDAGRDHPVLAPATQALEKIQEPIDRAAAATTRAAEPVKKTVDTAASWGVPGAKQISGIIVIAAGVAAWWLKRRRKT